MFKKIFEGMTAAEMINHIHMHCDTSAGLRSLSDAELIEVYKSIFGEECV